MSKSIKEKIISIFRKIWEYIKVKYKEGMDELI